MAPLNAYFAHRELEIPPSKRKSYKNLQDAANIPWYHYINKSNNICYSLKSNTEKCKQRDAQRSRFLPVCFVYIDLCRFSADFVVCGNMVPEYGEPYLASNSEVYSKIN